MTSPTRKALVLGATGTIGRAVVAALAGRGDEVAVHCHAALPAARDLAAAAGGRSLAVTADLREEAAVRALVHRVADHFGGIDVVVLAARRRGLTPLDEATAADLRAHLDVAVTGGFVVAQEAAWVMERQETGGTIVFIADEAGRAADPGGVPRLASQAAVAGLARGLAAETRGRGGRVRVEYLEAPATDPANVAAAVLRVTPGRPEGGA